MANSKGAEKRARQSAKRRIQNAATKSDLRTQIKKLEAYIVQNDVENAQTALPLVMKRLEKAASKGLIHKNKAARTKSSLMMKFNALNTEDTSA